MNKKGITAVVVIVVLVIIGYLVWGGKGSTTVTNENTTPTATDTSATTAPSADKSAYAPVTKSTADSSLLGRLKSVSVSAAETGSRVALVNGTAGFSSEGVSGTVTLGDIAVEQGVGNTNYVLTTLAVASGGSTSQYLALFTDANGTLSDVSYALVGTNATITGLRADSVSGGFAATVTYSANGSQRTKIIPVSNGAFDESKEINF